MLTIDQVRQFWQKCGTATTENLYVGTPAEFISYGAQIRSPICTAVLRMIAEAPECERRASA